jgi:hypothetical protein
MRHLPSGIKEMTYKNIVACFSSSSTLESNIFTTKSWDHALVAARRNTIEHWARRGIADPAVPLDIAVGGLELTSVPSDELASVPSDFEFEHVQT